MYCQYFGLQSAPFTISPDPDFLYLSQSHREALAHLVYGIKDQGGFIVLTGEVGTGKTTLVRTILQTSDLHLSVALVVNPRLSDRDLLATICDEFSITYPEHASLKTLIDLLNQYLLNNYADHRYSAVIIDEAQHLSISALEMIRLLTNLETNKARLLKVILVGQPELKTLLAQPALRQVVQRITGRYHLPALERDDIENYLQHRLRIVGCTRPLFTQKAAMRLFHYSRGIPRLLNVLSDRALLGTFVDQQNMVNAKHIDHAAQELGLDRRRWIFVPYAYRYPLFISLMIISALFYLLYAVWSSHDVSSVNTSTEPLFIQNQADDIAQIEPIKSTFTSETNQEKATHFSQDNQILSVSEPKITPIQTLHSQLAAIGNPHEPFWRLLVLWGLTTAPDIDEQRCRWLDTKGMTCFNYPVDFEQIISINLPTLFQLRLAPNHMTEVLLHHIQGQNITLETPAGTVQTNLQHFKTLLTELNWQGEALILWKPAMGKTQIGPGERGGAVEMLIQQLRSVGFAPKKSHQHYDGDVIEAVSKFQANRHLTVDGIAGTYTLIHLNHALHPNMRLQAPITEQVD